MRPVIVRWTVVLAALAPLVLASARHAAVADTSPQPVPFAQDWSDTGMILVDDNWSGVPGVIGYRGDGLAPTGTDPQTVTVDGSGTPVDVNANEGNPNTLMVGGLAEFELADAVVALQGSGTAEAPHVVLTLDTTGSTEIQISYNLRDIDGSADNAVQQVALQYRVGSVGPYTNLPDGYVADATTGPSQSDLVTPVTVALPPQVEDQALVQLRIITADALLADEWVGVDDIVVTGNCTVSWDGGAGTSSWHDAANWSLDTRPGPADDVCIPDMDPDVTVTHSAGPTQILSLNSFEAIAVTGGILEITDSAEPSGISNDYTQSGGALKGAADLLVTGAFTLSGGIMEGVGSVTVDSAEPAGLTEAGLKSLRSGWTLTVASGTAMTWSGGDLMIADATLEIQGTLSQTADQTVLAEGTSPLVHVASGGTWHAASATSEIQAAFDNQGTVDVASSTTLDLTGAFANYSAGTLTGGTYDLSGVLRFADADVVTNAAAVTLDGAGSAILDLTGQDGLRNLGTNAPEGSLTIANGRNLVTPGALFTAGAVEVGDSSTITTTGNYAQTAGSTLLETATSLLVADGGVVDIQGGTLQGVGTVSPALSNSGEVAPGLSPGILQVTGDLTQSAAGALSIEIGGTLPGTGHDQLAATGAATLGGTLDISTIDGFVPTAGQSFQIVTSASRTGTFATVTGTTINVRLYYAVQYTATGVTLRVQQVKILVDPTSGPPGTVVEVKGQGFLGGETVDISFRDSAGVTTVVGSATATGAGRMSTNVTIPLDAAAGSGRVTSTGQSSGRTAQARFTVS